MFVSSIVIGVVSLLFSYILNTFLLKFSSNLGIRNNEVAIIRFNKTSKPALGGISMFLVFLFTLIFCSFTNFNSSNQPFLLSLFLGSTLAFLVGFYDDAYNTKPFVKFLGQFLCATILVYFDVKISIFESTLLNILLTYIWVIGIMNSINMLDNMDAVTTISSIVIIVGVLLLQKDYLYHNPILFLLSISVLLSLVGFLFFNWYPSKMFMGDTGSQFLGFFLAVIGIEYVFNIPTLSYGYFEGKLIPFLFLYMIFIIPLTDTLTVSVNRMLDGKSPFVGGKDHTTHFLYYLGLSEHMVAFTTLILGILSSLCAILIFYSKEPLFLLFSGVSVIISVFLYVNTIKPINLFFKKIIFRERMMAKNQSIINIEQKMDSSKEILSNEAT
jgi:UDP-GlcNAc:undecaprenyl-phosphate GlcNAc-1-phosphate transferase